MTERKIQESIVKFESWLEKYGFLSYDRMDYWASRTGITAKKIFYKNKIMGAPLAFWGLVLENFLPHLMKLYGKPKREIIGDAHFALTYLNLYLYFKDEKYLLKAEELLSEMLSYSVKGYSGLCWGYNFGWQTQNGYWEKGIPLITITPYAFWAFKKHFEITGNATSLKNCLSIAEFAFKDLCETITSNGTWSSSYSPVTSDIVINANTYRAAVLLDSVKLGGPQDYLKAADRNIEFVLSWQGEKGEWFYEAKGPENNFVDNFHTCFILRNLFYCYSVTKDEKILRAIQKGYTYYRKYLFSENGRPRHFSKAKYIKMRKYEMYDYAEGILLGTLLDEIIEGAFDHSEDLAEDLIDHFQTEKGYFITRVSTFNIKHRVPYLRWPQAQLVYGLSNLLLKKSNLVKKGIV